MSDDRFGCADGSCPFYTRLGMHTNGGCKCVHEVFPDGTTRRLVDAMLRKAREVAASDERVLMRRSAAQRDRAGRIREIKDALGAATDREIIAYRRELRAELARLENNEG